MSFRTEIAVFASSLPNESAPFDHDSQNSDLSAVPMIEDNGSDASTLSSAV
jgi:hypothetical protein